MYRKKNQAFLRYTGDMKEIMRNTLKLKTQTNFCNFQVMGLEMIVETKAKTVLRSTESEEKTYVKCKTIWFKKDHTL